MREGDSAKGCFSLLSGFTGVVLQQIERPANDWIIFRRQLINAERRRRLLLGCKRWRGRGDLHSRDYTIFENRLILRRVVIGDGEHKRGTIFERNNLLLGGGTEGTLANNVAAMIIPNRGGHDLGGTGGAGRDQDGDRTVPDNFVGGGVEFLAGHGLPFQDGNRAGRNQELGSGNSF